MAAGWMSRTQCPDELQVTEYFPISARGQVSTHSSLLRVAAADQLVSKVPRQPEASPYTCCSWARQGGCDLEHCLMQPRATTPVCSAW